VAFLEVENRVRWISLRKENLPGRQLDNSPSQACTGQEGLNIKHGLIKLYHLKFPPSPGHNHAGRQGAACATALFRNHNGTSAARKD
jgi:hypothetical protein